MEALSARLKALRAMRTGKREREQALLERLMVRNRNPHRRTGYWQRLEHVRRLLRRVNEHAGWLVRGDGGRVKELVELLEIEERLVEDAIPKAAARFTEELIAREHFIPLAVAIVAALASVYVLERQILRGLRGAVAEMRVLIPTMSCNSMEDVGEVVTTPVKIKHARPQKRYFWGEADAPPPAKRMKSVGAKGTRVECVKEMKVEMDVGMTGSLFDAMAEDDSDLAELAKASIMSGKRLVISRGEGKQPRKSPLKKRDLSPADKSSAQSGKVDSQVGKEAQGEDSGSEDLDDIFAGLSD